MLFSELTDFEVAVESSRVKALLPADLSSEELSRLSAEIKRAAEFSARVTNARFLQGVQNVMESILNPAQVVGVTTGLSPATARDELRRLADELGVDAIQSDARIDLIVNTQTDLAYGFGAFKQGNTATSREIYPCQELYRLGWRKVPRDWEERWDAAGGEFYGGRMVARKDDEIWQALGDGEGGYEDTLGNPYPPFAFNSGMWTTPVSRDEAVELGVIAEDDDVEESELDMIDGLGAGVESLDALLLSALKESIGGAFKVVKGVLMASEGNRVVIWNGLPIVIETEAGEVRHGLTSDGEVWSSVMPYPYGYFFGTRADDNQGLDVFVGPDPASERVFVIHHYNPATRLFDELKSMVGFADPEAAKLAYFDSFSDGSGPEHFGAIDEFSAEEFSEFVRSGQGTVAELKEAA